METKKNKSLNLEKTKSSNFMLGLSIITALTLTAFSYGDIDEIEKPKKNYELTQDLIVQREDIVEPPKPQIIPPQTQIPKQDPAPEIDLNQDINTTPNLSGSLT